MQMPVMSSIMFKSCIQGPLGTDVCTKLLLFVKLILEHTFDIFWLPPRSTMCIFCQVRAKIEKT